MHGYTCGTLGRLGGVAIPADTLTLPFDWQGDGVPDDGKWITGLTAASPVLDAARRVLLRA